MHPHVPPFSPLCAQHSSEGGTCSPRQAMLLEPPDSEMSLDPWWQVPTDPSAA